MRLYGDLLRAVRQLPGVGLPVEGPCDGRRGGDKMAAIADSNPRTPLLIFCHALSDDGLLRVWKRFP